MLSPLALAHMRDHWRPGSWLLGFAFILGAVLISGMRSAWIMMFVVMACFMMPLLRDEKSRKLAVALPLIAAATLAVAIASSPLLQDRLKLTSLAVLGTEQAIDEASSYRVPIFKNALVMYRDHPINGVGVRAFRKAYLGYAETGDIHFIEGGTNTRAHQAHNFVLEFMADTGTIGLLGVPGSIIFWLSRLARHEQSCQESGISLRGGAHGHRVPAKFLFCVLWRVHDVHHLGADRAVGGCDLV